MIDKNNIPKHIAIIMDGNGRWAAGRHLPRTSGHKQGVARVKEIVNASAKLGVKVLTLFAFSTENWARPKREISILMRFLNNFLDSQIKDLIKNNIRLLFIGRSYPIPEFLLKKMKEAQARTKNNSGLTLVLALNYGSKQEIIDAVKKCCRDAAEGRINLENFDIQDFDRYLYTAGLPDPDLLIRTSGEMRMSNFLLWQLSYAELYFPKKFWPDFGAGDLENAIKEFQKRERRFGKSGAN